MKKQIEAKDGNNLVLINIETENNYFSITVDYLEPLDKYLEELEMTYEEAEEEWLLIDETMHKDKSYIMTGGGCMHELILKLRPDLKPLVDLHLSDTVEGKPMHAHSNGRYHLIHTGIETAAKYLRTTEEKLKPVLENDGFGYDDVYLSLLPQWKKEAKEGLEFIENLD